MTLGRTAPVEISREVPPAMSGVDEDALGVVVELGDAGGSAGDGDVADVDAGLTEGARGAGDDGVEVAGGGCGLGGLVGRGDGAVGAGDGGHGSDGDAHAFVRGELVEAAGRSEHRVVRVMGAGSGLPVLTRVMVGEPLISVAGVWLAVTAGKVATVPVTETTVADGGVRREAWSW